MELLPDPDGTFASYTPTPADNFRKIAQRLHDSINTPLEQSFIFGGQKPILPYSIKGEVIARIIMPLRAIKDGKKDSNAGGIKPSLDQLHADKPVGENASFYARQIQSAVVEANNTPGFWDWVAQQTPQRKRAEHPRIASGDLGDEGRGGGR